MIKSTALWSLSALVAAALVAGCGGRQALFSSAPEKRVVILGFDGVEPAVVDAMLAAGELPNLAALRDRGTYQRLRSTIPPQSPAAWSSFATCKNPGDHGVYDFLRRNARDYTVLPGMGLFQHPQVGYGETVRVPARMTSFRRGESFWAVADRQGARGVMLHVPFAFPPDDLENSWMLCGEGVPALRGNTTHFYALSDAFTPEQLEEDVPGGVRIPLDFQGDVAQVSLPGALDFTEKDLSFIETPLTIRVNRPERTVTLEAQGQTVEVAEGGWSDWMEWTFEVTPEFTERAISAVHAIEVGEKVRLYMASMQFHPRAPYVPFTAPDSYAGELADLYGLYETVGWKHDTHALRQDALEEDGFLEHARQADAWLETLTLDELDRRRSHLTVAVWTSPDRVSHMFWRFRDPEHPLYTEEGGRRYGRVIEDTYLRMDAIVGKVAAKLDPDDLLMVISDHGFHSFRTGFSVNTWLVRNGYLALKGRPDAATAYSRENEEQLVGVDWSRTKAYGLGLGSIYLNMKGREGDGIVDPSEAGSLLTELREKLLAVTDPATGKPIFNTIYTSEVFRGATEAHAPDLQLGYAEGFQTAKESAKGAVPVEIFEPNHDKWSGEHASSDCESTPGILFANRPLAQDPAIVDIGVTALRYLELDVPKDFTGKPLLAEVAPAL